MAEPSLNESAGLGGLDVGVRSQMAAQLDKLGAEEPADLAELEPSEVAELSALVVKVIHKRKFDKAVAALKAAYKLGYRSPSRRAAVRVG